MDYSKWDRFRVDDSDDESPDSDEEREQRAARLRPGPSGATANIPPSRPVDKAAAAAETLLRFTRVERVAEDVRALDAMPHL